MLYTEVDIRHLTSCLYGSMSPKTALGIGNYVGG